MSEFANIPTYYKNGRFRSRLEARWACMFELLGWTAEYEPVDLNGWIPDFLITNAPKTFYVEVKPDRVFPNEEALKIERAIGYDRNAVNVVPDAWEDHDDELDINVFITSSGLLPNEEQPGYSIGWVLDPWFGYSVADVPWSNAVLMSPCDSPSSKIGLTADGAGFYGDVTGGCGRECCKHDGTHNYRPEDADVFQRLWAEAGNRTQWKAPR